MRDYVKELSEDWIVRDKDTFVHKRNQGRLGWENSLKPGQGYSTFLLDSPTQLEMLKRAFPLAKNMVLAMGIPGKVNVKLSRNDSYTDGKTIYIATDVFNHEEIENGKKLDIFLGCAVHEGAHILYTDFSDNAYLEGRSRAEAKWIAKLANIIEDEYIEHRLGDRKPGLANFLEATKWYIFGLYVGKMDEVKANAFSQLVDAFLGLVRYPRLLTEETINRYGEYLVKAKDILTPYPTCTAQCNAAAVRIFDIFKEFLQASAEESIKKENRKDSVEDGEDHSDEELDCDDDTEIEISFGDDNDDEEAGEDARSSEEYDDSSEEMKGTSEECGDSSEESDKSAEECEVSSEEYDDSAEKCNDSSEKKAHSPEEYEDSSEESGRTVRKIKININPVPDTDSPEEKPEGKGIRISDRLRKKIDEAIEKFLSDQFDALEEALDAATPAANDGRDSDRKADILKENKINARMAEGEIEEGNGKEVYFINAEQNKCKYEQDYEVIRPYIASMRKTIKSHFKEYRIIHHCQRHGKLESRKLTEAFLGSKTVYARKGEVTTDKIAVCILVDESGSMLGTKEKRARQTAILLNEALSGIPDVEPFIYGHTGDIMTDSSTEIRVYRDKKFRGQYALGDIQARSQNRDGTAILETAKRVRKQTDRPVLMFIISDGEPYAHNYRGGYAIQDTKSKVEQIEKMGFSPIQICIDSCYDPSLMFRNYVKLTDLGTLSVELTKVIRDALKRNTASHIR